MNGRASSLEHDPSASLRKPPREQSRWLMALAGVARLPLMLAGAAPLVSGALLVAQAWLLASVLDAAIVRHVARQELLGQILAIVALILVRACITWAGERAGADAAERIKRHVRQALFARLLQKDLTGAADRPRVKSPARWWIRSRRSTAFSPSTCRPWPRRRCCRWRFRYCCCRST